MILGHHGQLKTDSSISIPINPEIAFLSKELKKIGI
jgi:hypothetical protein